MEKPLKILLADDEEIVYQTISGYLLDLGHQVDGAWDAFNVIKAIEEKQFDMAIIDIRMPGMNGVFFLSIIQEISPETQVVIIAGHGNVDMAIKALKLGAIDFLIKPVRLIEIDATLEKASRLRMYAFQHSSDIEKIKSIEGRLQTEITKCRETEAALQEAERRIAQLLRN